MAHILIVDDEPHMCWILSTIFKEDQHTIKEASTVQEALILLSKYRYDLVITDQQLGDGEGLSILSACKELDPTLPVILLTAYATIELAVESLRRGAFDFLTKPFMPDAVRAAVNRACERAELARENQGLKDVISQYTGSDDLVGNSAAMRAVRDFIGRVAPTNATVLITGETGCGKELVAQAIHKNSRRAENLFLAVNCAALTETLLESELFGHERGAFTGANRTRQGMFETAHGGTLFLDEAGEMSLGLQTKLLRVLNDSQIFRVGSNTPRKVDVRILVASNRDLLKQVEARQFREDLYYRLAVVPLAIPPLRERIEDIPVLVNYFLEKVSRGLNVTACPIKPEALDKLTRYHFPGNIRELKNLIERAYILSNGREFSPEDFLITPKDERLPTPVPASQEKSANWCDELLSQGDLRLSLESVERELLVRALHNAHGVQAKAARQLGISRSDFSYKIKKYKMDHGSEDEPSGNSSLKSGVQ